MIGKAMKMRQLRWELPFHLMLIPGVIVTLIYAYGPMFGIVMAFQKFEPILSFWGSEFVGWKNFEYVFNLPDFNQVLFNTVLIAVLKIIFGLLVPLLLALLLNELTKDWLKKIIQTSIFLPFFLSWTVLGGVIMQLLLLDGPVNSLISDFGFEPMAAAGEYC